MKHTPVPPDVRVVAEAGAGTCRLHEFTHLGTTYAPEGRSVSAREGAQAGRVYGWAGLRRTTVESCHWQGLLGAQ